MVDLAALELSQLLHIKDVQLDFFSPNELLDDINTNDMQYLAVDFFIAARYSTVAVDRPEGLLKAEKHLTDFLSTCRAVQLPFGPDKPSIDPALQRQEKIGRFKQIRELEAKCRTRPSGDDDSRQYWMDWLVCLWLKAIDELDAVRLELEAIRRPARGALQVQPSTVQAPRNFTLTRSRQSVLGSVFRPAHALPTMTIDEYLRLEAERGGIVHGTGSAGPADDPETDADFDRLTARLRARDDRWDLLARGTGNRHNRS